MNPGKKIVQSCELVDNLWMQINDLGNSLIAMTEFALANGKFESLRSAGSARSSFEVSASGWGYSSYAISFPVMEKKRRKIVPSAWINYQISVFGSGIPPSSNGAEESIGPVLHVSFWHVSTDFKESGSYIEFPPVWDDWEIKDGNLLFWKNENYCQFPQWTFSIRLLDLNNEDAVQMAVIEPFSALLSGTLNDGEISAALPGAICYTDNQNKAFEWSITAC